MLVAWTPHEQVAGAPLDVEHAEDVAVLELADRESLRLPVLDFKNRRPNLLVVLDCHLVRVPSYFAATLACY